MSYHFEFESVSETTALATFIAELSQSGDVITLRGQLGAGKSEFSRAFIRALMGLDTEVPSPTFTLVQTYEAPDVVIWHFDLYRLQNLEEIWELGLEEALHRGISLIEWPERIKGVTLRNHLDILITTSPHSDRRVFDLMPDPGWQQRLDDCHDS